MTTTTKPRTAPPHVLRPSRVRTVKVVQSQDDKIKFEYEGLKQERQRMYAARSTNPATPLRISNAGSSKHYDGAELMPYIGRPNACAGLALPSRVGVRLYFRDGRVTDLSGQTIKPTEYPS